MTARSIEVSALVAAVWLGAGCHLAHGREDPSAHAPAEPGRACPPDVVEHQRFAPAFGGELTHCDTVRDGELPAIAELGDVSLDVSAVTVATPGDGALRVDVDLDFEGSARRLGVWRGAGREPHWTAENGCVLDVPSFCAGDVCAGIDVCGGLSCGEPHVYGDGGLMPSCGGNPGFELRRWETAPDEEQARRGVVSVAHVESLRVLELDVDAETGVWSTVSFGRTHSVEERGTPTTDVDGPVTE